MEKEKKTNRTKWIAAIAIIIIVILAAGFYFKIFSIPTGLMAGLPGTSQPETKPPEEPTVTITGAEVLSKEFTKTLPYYESIDLEPGRYGIQVIADKPIMILIFNDFEFNDWQQGRVPNFIGGTGYDPTKNSDNFIQTFDVKKGEGGKFYIVFTETGDVSIKLKLTQQIKF